MVLTLVKQRQNFFLSFHYNNVNSYLCVNKTEIYKFKAQDNIGWYKFCLGNVSKDFIENEQSEISLNCVVYDFLVDHISVEKEDILNIHEYLMVKDNIK